MLSRVETFKIYFVNRLTGKQIYRKKYRCRGEPGNGGQLPLRQKTGGRRFQLVLPPSALFRKFQNRILPSATGLVMEIVTLCS